MARVLIVDDDTDFVRSTRRVLLPYGYQVSAESDSGKALALMERTRPDLLLLDGVIRARQRQRASDGVYVTQQALEGCPYSIDHLDASHGPCQPRAR